MKKILFFSIALHLLIIADLYSQSGWFWQNPLPQGNDAYDIKMFNSGTGYCRTDYCILKTTNMGNNWQIILTVDLGLTDIDFLNVLTGYYAKGRWIYKTANGGSSWSVLFTYNDFYPNQMNWLNEMTGYAMQSSSYAGTKMNKTTNGGLGWFTVFNDTSIFIKAFSFPSVTTGYIAGVTRQSIHWNAKFLKSTNSGINWDSVTISNLRELQTVHFINGQSGYLSGTRVRTNGPSMLRTSNGGLTWDSLIFVPGNMFSKLYFLDFSTGYGYSGTLKKTTDAGLNWNILGNSSEAGIYTLDFSLNDNQNIYLCGRSGTVGKSTNGGLNWSANSSGFYGHLYSIKFFDANTGIAAGEGNGGVYLRTTNSGLSWDTNTIDENYLENIFISNENTAYVAGCGKIFRTTNKGASFTAFPTQSGSAWSDVSFPNENTGYCIYKYRVVDKTTDGGNTWVNILPQSFGEFFTICFINGNTGFFGGSKIFKTTNGGTSWDTVTTGLQTNYFCNKLRYVNGILYSIGWSNSQYSGIFMKSTNEGINWQIDSFQDEDIYDISIPVPNVTYLIGYYHNIYKSVNNSPWEKYNIFTTAGYSGSICFVNKDTGFVSTYYGGILKTTDGGGTPIGIIGQSNEIPTKFSLSQNYPNPFNPTTMISYSLPKNSFVTIKVYDLLGRLVEELVNKNQSPGNYNVTFEGQNFASGVYFYTIETPDFTQSKKMVLLK